MSQQLSRRQFGFAAGTALVSALVTPARAIEPFKRPGKSRLSLSLAAYSFRQYFKDTTERNRAAADKQIDLLDFIDFCAEHHCHGAELTSYYFPKEVTNEFLLKIKHHAFLRGIELSGTAVGNTFTHPPGERSQREIAHVKKWIDYSALIGFPHIRVFAGNTDRQTFQAAKKNCIAALEECCDYAASRGVFLGIENHGGIVAEADALLDIIKSVNSPWLGVNLDTGNFHTEDPYADLARCAPYAVNVQVKTEIRPKNGGTQNTDLKRIIQILRDANYQGYLVLEYEAAEDPFKAVPRTLSEMAALI